MSLEVDETSDIGWKEHVSVTCMSNQAAATLLAQVEWEGDGEDEDVGAAPRHLSSFSSHTTSNSPEAGTKSLNAGTLKGLAGP